MDPAAVPMDHYRTLDAISKCRTAALGGHIDACDDCGHLRISYNSCRNRHCPKCQGVNKEMWIIMQEDMLLPVLYYHIVFTLPHEFNILCMYNPRTMYNLLFKTTWYVLKKFASDHKWMGAQSTATMVLHTWSQTLALHPHLHCIVPNGGLDRDGNWKNAKYSKNDFLFPIAALRKVYKGYFMHHLLAMIDNEEIYVPHGYFNKFGSKQKWKNTLYTKDWNIFTKKPFAGTKHVINYLGRYSHRVAITNYRILNLDTAASLVTFSYKDYKDRNKTKIMTIPVHEFVRRFCLHILPKRFRKIRQFGFTANACKAKKIAQARMSLQCRAKALLDKQARKQLALQRLNIDFDRCPKCKAKLKTILLFSASRPPPQQYTHSKK